MPFNNYIEKEFKEIVALLSKREYVIPRFQRGLVWKREQVANFLDSILMGYPTGIFVLWKSKEKLACRSMGDSAPKELKEGEVFYILDGQQRMSALYLVYEGLTLPQAKGVEEDYKDILLRVKPDANGEYCFVKPKKSEKIEQAIRATDLLRNESIYDIEEKYGLDKKTAREFERFRTKLLNYKFPIVEITDASLEEIIKIFTRINTGGTKLSLSEILYAKFYIAPKNTQKGFDLEAHFKELQDELKSLDYGFNSCVVVLQLISFILRYNASGNLTEKISTSTLDHIGEKSIVLSETIFRDYDSKNLEKAYFLYTDAGVKENRVMCGYCLYSFENGYFKEMNRYKCPLKSSLNESSKAEKQAIVTSMKNLQPMLKKGKLDSSYKLFVIGDNQAVINGYKCKNEGFILESGFRNIEYKWCKRGSDACNKVVDAIVNLRG